ncbi:MAG: hypothetical protein L6Q78_15790 [Bacteroidia bacterium]|nr:hypothetical protein [Bacteroidia bacterium]
MRVLFWMMLLPILHSSTQAKSKKSSCLDSLRIEERRYESAVNLCVKQLPSLTKEQKKYLKGVKAFPGDNSCLERIITLRSKRDSLLMELRDFQMLKRCELDSLKRVVISANSSNVTRQYKKAFYAYSRKNSVIEETLGKLNINGLASAVERSTSIYKNALLNADAKSQIPELPTYYQTRKKVNESLPFNQPGVEPKDKKKVEDNIKRVQHSFYALKDSMNSDSFKLFNVNPFRAKPFNKRFANVFTWSPQRPALPGSVLNIEMLYGLKYNQSSKFNLTTNIGCTVALLGEYLPTSVGLENYILGAMGRWDWNKQLNLFLNYEVLVFPNSNPEIKTSSNDRLMFGIENKNLLNTQLGLNLFALSKKNQQLVYIRFSL